MRVNVMLGFIYESLIGIMNWLLVISCTNTPLWCTSTKLQLLSSSFFTLTSFHKKLWKSSLCTSEEKFCSYTTKRTFFHKRSFNCSYIIFRLILILIFSGLPIRIVIADSSIISSLNITKMGIGIFDSFFINKIPILNKVSDHIDYRISLCLNPNIMPRHSWLFLSINRRRLIVFCSSCFILSNSLISVIASIPTIVNIGDWMGGNIPSSITKIEPSHETNSLINYTTFLMMSP